MDELKQKAIKRHYANLVDCMNSLRVMDRLGHLLSLEEMDLIRKLQFTHQERTRELIAILLRKNEELRPFDCFIEALEDTDENHKTIAEAILKTYKHDNGAAEFERGSRTSLSDAGKTKYDLQIAQQSLKEMYLTRFQKVYPFSLPFTFDIENTWVSLAIKGEKKDSRVTEDHAELLKKAFDKVKMLIIEGNPATGKTALMRKLAYEWAKGKQELVHYDLVLYAEFREVREKTFKSIADLVLSGLEKYLTKEGHEYLKKIVNNEEFCKKHRILVLLDGYDESSLEKQCSELSSYLKEKTIEKPLFFHTVLTTRQGHLSNLRGREGRFVFAEVLGFITKQQKEKYVYNHFLSSELDNKRNIAAVHSLLDNNENLNKLAETPLFLTFICLVHERFFDNTLLEFYCSIIWWVIDRYQQDFPDRDVPALFGFQTGSYDKFETIEDHYLHFPQLHCLGNMALSNLKENVFKPSDCAQFNLKPIIEQVGLLRKERIYDNLFKPKTLFIFPQSSVQEFLAAYYCFCSNDPASEWLLPNSISDASQMNEFERFLFRIALSDKMPIKTEKRKYYFERIAAINLDITFDAFKTTSGFNNKLLNWFLLQCKNVQNIKLNGELNSARHESNMLNDSSILNESAITSRISRPTLLSFGDLTKLHSLSFEGFIFEANSQLSFTNCPFLKTLQFYYCEIKSNATLGIATTPATDTVEFIECKIDLATWQTITEEIRNSSVKYLKLSSDNFLEENNFEFSHHLQKCERIEEIFVLDDDANIPDGSEEDYTESLCQLAQIMPRLKSFVYVSPYGKKLKDSIKERIEKAGQERNPDFSMEYVQNEISTRSRKRIELGKIDSLQEQSTLRAFLDQILHWLDKTHANWKDTMRAEFSSRTETICNIRQYKKMATYEANELFYDKFLKLKLGGALIGDFEELSFVKVMQSTGISSFEDTQRKEKLFKCDLIFIHQQVGIVVIKAKTYSNGKVSPQQLEETDEDIQYQIRGLENLYQQFSYKLSVENKCPFKIRGIIYLPDVDIKSEGDLGSSYCQVVDKSLLNDDMKFKEFWNNMAINSLKSTDTSLKFIAAIFLYRQVKDGFVMSSNALEMYGQGEEEKKFEKSETDRANTDPLITPKDRKFEESETEQVDANPSEIVEETERRTEIQMKKVPELNEMHQDNVNVSPLTNLNAKDIASPQVNVVNQSANLSQSDLVSQVEVDVKPRGNEMAQVTEKIEAVIAQKDEQLSSAKRYSQSKAVPIMIATFEQSEAIDSETNRVFICGPPGTGKTHCLFLRALNAAKKKEEGRVVISTNSVQQLKHKFEKFRLKNEGVKREIVIVSENDNPSYSKNDDLFFDESILWDNNEEEQKVKRDLTCLRNKIVQLTNNNRQTATIISDRITVVGWVPPHLMEEARIIFSEFEFHELKSIMRGTKEIMNEWIGKITKHEHSFQPGHNFTGAPVERCTVTCINDMFGTLIRKIRSLLTSTSPADIAIIIGSEFSHINGDISHLKKHFKDHGIPCGSCGEQAKNSRLIALSNAETVPSFDWPIVIVVVYTDGKSDYKETTDYVTSVSRAILELTVVECIADQELQKREKLIDKAQVQDDISELYEKAHPSENNSLQELSTSKSFLEQVLPWLDRHYSAWRITINVAFSSQTATICNIRRNNKMIRTEELPEIEVSHLKTSANEFFYEKFLKLKLGGILICGFEGRSFIEVMQSTAVPGFQEAQRNRKQFKCDFIFIHQQIGIVIITIKTYNSEQVSPEQLIESGEDIQYQIRGLEKLYEQFSDKLSDENKCPFKICGIMCLPDTDIKYKENLEINYCQLVDKSLLDDDIKFKNFWNNMAGNSFAPTDTSLKFIASVFLYRQVKDGFAMSSNALEMYRLYGQNDKYHDTYLDFIKYEIEDTRESVITKTVGVTREQTKVRVASQLSRAVRAMDWRKVEEIIKGGDFEVKKEELAGRTALIHAVCLPGVKEAEELIETTQKIVDSSGYTELEAETIQLHKKFEQPIINIARLLMKNGYSPLSQTKDSKRSAVHFASITGNEKLIEVLLDKPIVQRSVLACKDSLNRTPLHYVSQGPKNEHSANTVHQIMKDNDEGSAEKDLHGCTALLLAVDDDNYFVVRALLKYKKFKNNINEPNFDGRTPLFFAEKNPSMIDLLLQNGADVNLIDKFGQKAYLMKRVQGRYSHDRSKTSKDSVTPQKDGQSAPKPGSYAEQIPRQQDSPFKLFPGSDTRGLLRSSEYITSENSDQTSSREPDISPAIQNAEPSAAVFESQMENSKKKRTCNDIATERLEKEWEKNHGEPIYRLQKWLFLGANPTKIDEKKRYSRLHKLLSDFLNNPEREKLNNIVKQRCEQYEEDFYVQEAELCETLLGALNNFGIEIYLNIYEKVSEIINDGYILTNENIIDLQNLCSKAPHRVNEIPIKDGKKLAELCTQLGQTVVHLGNTALKKICSQFFTTAITLKLHRSTLNKLKDYCAPLKHILKKENLEDSKLEPLSDTQHNLVSNFLNDIEREKQLFAFLDTARDFWKKGHENLTNGCKRTNKLFAVALDGGGIHGLITSMILRFVAGRMFGNEVCWNENFQWYIGTSTGAITALSLIKNNNPNTLSQCIHFYWSLKSEVFYKSRPFKNDGSLKFHQIIPCHASEQSQKLMQMLKEEFEDDMLFTQYHEENFPRVAIASYNATINPGHLKLFRNYKIPHVKHDDDGTESKDTKLYEIACAASAAPTLILPVESNNKNEAINSIRTVYLDGIFAANCPLGILFKEIDQIYPEIYDQKNVIGGILSIGTGFKKERERTPLGLNTMIDLLRQQATSEDRLSLMCSVARCKAQKIPLLRLSPENISVKLDEPKENELIDMLWKTLEYLCEDKQIEKIDEFASVYMDKHDQTLAHSEIRGNNSAHVTSSASTGVIGTNLGFQTQDVDGEILKNYDTLNNMHFGSTNRNVAFIQSATEAAGGKPIHVKSPEKPMKKNPKPWRSRIRNFFSKQEVLLRRCFAMN